MQESAIASRLCSFGGSREESGTEWRNRKPGGRRAFVSLVSSAVMMMGEGATHKEGVGRACQVAHGGIGCYC